MTENGNYINELKDSLESETEELLISQIKKLRERKSTPGVIILLRDLYEKTESDLVKSEIERFINDLNDQSMTSEVIEAIDTSTNSSARQKFISSCWQSGLDYSAHIESFILYSIEGTYPEAIECYSVIEEWISTADPDERPAWKTSLLSSLDKQSEDKTALLGAIIELL